MFQSDQDGGGPAPSPPGMEESPRNGSLLARLQRSRNQESFWIALLAFSIRVEQVLAPTP